MKSDLAIGIRALRGDKQNHDRKLFFVIVIALS
jgi:hypothetical protein